MHILQGKDSVYYECGVDRVGTLAVRAPCKLKHKEYAAIGALRMPIVACYMGIFYVLLKVKRTLNLVS